MKFEPRLALATLFLASQFQGCVQKSPAGPPGLLAAQAAFDPASGYLVLTNGDLDKIRFSQESWAYDTRNARWLALVANTGLINCNTSLTFDEKAGAFVLFASARWPSGLAGKPEEISETWSLDTSTRQWFRLDASNPPPVGMIGASLVYDGKTRSSILYGGRSRISGEFLKECWSYDYGARAWTRQSRTASPPPRSFAPMTHDAASGKDLLFGGTTATPGWLEPQKTWMYDAALDAWSYSDDQGPGHLVETSLTYVPELKASLLFGGIRGSPPVPSGETWLFDASSGAWRKLNPAHAPSARGYHAAAWDGASKRLWLYGGGADPFHASEELWYFDPASMDWRQVRRAKR